MLRLLIISGLFIGIGAAQQPTSHIIAGPILPSRCSYLSGDVFFLSSPTNTGLYLCGAGNTFSVGPLYNQTFSNNIIGTLVLGAGSNSTLPYVSATNTLSQDASSCYSSTAHRLSLGSCNTTGLQSGEVLDITGSILHRGNSGGVANFTANGIVFLRDSTAVSTDQTYIDFPIINFRDPSNTFSVDGQIIRAGAKFLTYATSTLCTSAASPSVCAAAAAGNVLMATGATTLQVNTTAVTTNSTISITRNDSLGTVLGSVTCDTQSSLVIGTPRVSAVSTGASFTISIDLGTTSNPLCLTYSIVN